MNDELLAIVSYWLTIGQWMAIACVFVVDCWIVHSASKRTYARARDLGNGKVAIARRRLRISTWFLWGSAAAFITVALAAYNSIFIEQVYEDPTLISSIVRELLVFMLFCFWRAKRNNVYQIREVEARERALKQQLAKGPR